MDLCDVTGIWRSALSCGVLSICTGGWGRKTSVVQVFPILLQIRGFQTYRNTLNIPILPPSPLPPALPPPQEMSVLGQEHTCGDIPS